MGLLELIKNIVTGLKRLEVIKLPTQGFFYPSDFGFRIGKATDEDIIDYEFNFDGDNIILVIELVKKILAGKEDEGSIFDPNNLSILFDKKLNYSFFCNSGAEAVDGAIKMAYKYHSGKRKLILHSDIAFHGKLLGSMSVSADRENTFKFPKINFGKSFKYNDIKSLQLKIKKYKASNIFAIIVEPFSASTYKSCSYEFLSQCITLGKKYDIKIIFDEIYTGFGKTGSMFYFQKYKNIPQLCQQVICQR